MSFVVKFFKSQNYLNSKKLVNIISILILILPIIFLYKLRRDLEPRYLTILDFSKFQNKVNRALVISSDSSYNAVRLNYYLNNDYRKSIVDYMDISKIKNFDAKSYSENNIYDLVILLDQSEILNFKKDIYIKKMKLLIQIPCYNEENDILNTLNQLPKKLDGVDIIEIVIVNDGSEDNTIKEVKKYNDLKTHIINLPIRKGLSNAFTTGINFCLKQSADIIVNTDADNQYDSSNIQDLINPIINGKSDIVIGARNFKNIKSFSKTKVFSKFG